MADAVPEGFIGLTTQSAPRVINNGAADEDRKAQLLVLKEALQSVDGCLGVESVKDGFDQEHVNSTIIQCLNLLIDVSASLQELIVDVGDDIRAGDDQQVIVAPQLMRRSPLKSSSVSLKQQYMRLSCIVITRSIKTVTLYRQEGAMESTPDRLIAPEGEGNVGDAPTDLAARAFLLDLGCGINEVHSVIVVLRHASANSEDVGVKDDVFRVETHLLHQNHTWQPIHYLTLLIKGHDNHGSSMALDGGSVLPEGLLALLHGDGVDDALALAALEARLHNEELGGVNHEGHLADLRPGIWIAENIAVSAFAEILYVWLHVLCPKCTVQTNRHGFGMADAVPECLIGLTTQSTPRVVNNGAADEDRKTQLLVLKEALQSIDGCLRVESVKDGLNQEHVNSTIIQGLNLLIVCFLNSIISGASEGRVLHRW
ncbi:MAG: hypothetical protein FRX49_03478 [Trebouxia sp. A1-2]|nr:MAG: hypothetical protein FRX49_03478 [Trebouxia sp. A1-2]